MTKRWRSSTLARLFNGPAGGCTSALLLWAVTGSCMADTMVRGRVLDINGAPVKQALVTIHRPRELDGPSGTTVFTDVEGRFAFPRPVAASIRERVTVEVKGLGYRQVSPGAGPVPLAEFGDHAVADILFVMQPQRNKADTAPGSAWLRLIPDSDSRKALMVRECSACHSIVHGPMRDFVAALDSSPLTSPKESRKHSWQQLLRFMYGTYDQFWLSRMGMEETYDIGPTREGFLEPISDVLATYLPKRLDELDYDWGAPLAVTPDTQIYEYEVVDKRTGSIREAVLMGDPLKLWVVDISLDKMVLVDPVSGKQTDVPVPFGSVTAPHAITGGFDGKIWLTFLFNNVFGRIDPQTGTWDLVQRNTGAGDKFLVHDYALDWKTKVAKDTQGRIWFGDMTRNALGSTDLKTGKTTLYDAPKYHGRDSWYTLMYGTVITSDRKHVWYTQLNGNFGCINTETGEYETEVEMGEGVGPRRLAITEKDILYVPLFGSGQIVEYDARARRQIAVHDLPDRGAAPYAVTWDPGRQVLWVANSNADAIYRFDPKTRAFGVIPLPKKQAYLRMIQVEPNTGLLVSSYANMPERAPGPREALVIDPGDGFVKSNAVVPRMARPFAVETTAASAVDKPSRRVSAAELQRLSVSNLCVTCHAVNGTRNAPPFSAIAKRYANGQPRAAVEQVLGAKILYGGAGNWGSFPMIAQDHLLDAKKARELAAAILDLEESP